MLRDQITHHRNRPIAEMLRCIRDHHHCLSDSAADLAIGLGYQVVISLSLINLRTISHELLETLLHDVANKDCGRNEHDGLEQEHCGDQSVFIALDFFDANV